MKKLKFIGMLCLMVVLTAPLVQSCKKYEEGPAFSLRSKKSRLTGNWKLTGYSVDNGQYYENITFGLGYLSIDSNDKFSGSDLNGNNESSGVWSFSDSKSHLELSVSNGVLESELYEIIELRKSSLRLRYETTDTNNVEHVINLVYEKY